VAEILFEWDEANVEHIARHGYEPDEVEEVFARPYKVLRTREGKYTALGETDSGRPSFVVYIKLGHGRIRVITARDMNDWERRRRRRK